MCLWTGLMNIASKTSLMKHLSKVLSPILKVLFPKLSKDDESYSDISMNMVANILGLGNAATPLGIKAMNSLQKKNKNPDTLSNTMIMFIVVNTASIQLIPATLIALRASLGSDNPTKVILPIWFVSGMALIAGVTVTKVLVKAKGGNYD